MNTMDRRNFIKGTAATVAATAATGSMLASKAFGAEPLHLPAVSWKCIASWPEDLDTLMGGAVTVAERVKAMTGGKFQIEIFEDGKLNKKNDLLDAVSKGEAECGHTASDYFMDRDDAMAFVTSAPFGLSAAEHYAWLRYGGGQELAQGIYDKFNIVYFPAGNTGPQMGGWFKKEIKSSADLNGLKMRIGGIGAEVMKRLGVTTVSVPYLQLATALTDGRLDAAEFVGPYDDEKLGLNKVAPYYYSPGWWQYGDQLDFFVNRQAYESLPEEYRQILTSACREANALVLADYDSKNAAALARMVASGTKLKQFPLELMTTGYKIMQEIHAEKSAQNPLYKKMYTSWEQFRKEVSGWHRFVEGPMFDFERPKS